MMQNMVRPGTDWILLIVISLVLSCTLTTGAVAQDTSAASQDNSSHNVAPVVVDGRKLFSVRGVSAFPASRRAKLFEDRIIALAQDKSFNTGDLVLKEENDTTAIYAGDSIVLHVLDADAELEDIQRELLAEVFRLNVAEAITLYREDRSSTKLVNNSLVALAATIAFVLLTWGTKRLFRWLVNWAERDVRKGVNKLASKAHHVVRAGHMWALVAGLLRFLRLLSYLALTYFYLNIVLGLYPWTRPAARLLFSFVATPIRSLWQGFIDALPNLIFLAILWLVVTYLLKVIKAFFEAVETERIKLESFEPEWAAPTYKIVRIMIIAFAVVIAYPYIPGSDSLAFKGVSVFLGVLLSLGSSSFIANLVAGLAMTYRGAFREGDRIRVGDTEGVVEEVKVMTTRIRTPKNESVVVPNSNIMNTDVVNYTQLAKTDGLVLYTTVGIGYDVPWRQVEAMLLQAVDRTSGLLNDPEPFVLQTSLGDFAANYQVNAYCDDASQMPVLYSRLHANIQDVFNEHGVQIMSPAYVADPQTEKVVPPERWYEAPAQKPE